MAADVAGLRLCPIYGLVHAINVSSVFSLLCFLKTTGGRGLDVTYFPIYFTNGLMDFFINDSYANAAVIKAVHRRFRDYSPLSRYVSFGNTINGVATTILMTDVSKKNAVEVINGV